MLRALPIALIFPVFAAGLSAHGGQYVGGPVVIPPSAPVVGRPTGGSAGPSLPTVPRGAVITGARSVAPSAAQWQQWWEFNKEPFLERRTIVEAPPVTGSDDFYLGAGLRRPEDRVDLLAPTEADLRERLVPALSQMLGKERNRDIVTACLIALAKIGRDGAGIDLEQALAEHIKRDDQEVRETAVLALGIAGRKQALPMLAALLHDAAEGRRLEQRATVKDRTRAFAAYGIGLLGRRSDDVKFKQEARDQLLATLRDRRVRDRDLRVAVLTGLGVLGLDSQDSAHKRLLWGTVDELFAYLELDLGRGDENVQAHAPIAIARLLGRGDSHVHKRAKERLAALLEARNNKRSHPILRSAVVALGMLVQPQELNPEDAVFADVLRDTWSKANDRHSRYFALVALGRIGGDSNRTFLLRAYQRGQKSTERPWAALALGVLTFEAGSKGEPDIAVAQMLLDDLRAASDISLRAALAIAVGLTGHTAAGTTVLEQLRDNESEQRTAGYMCVSLALLGDRSAVPFLHGLLERSVRRPFLVQQCAVALGRLGDRGASVRLAAMMEKNDSVAVLAALARAIGRIGDRRSIEPLLALMADRELTKLARAFVAAALGGIGDKEALLWNVPLSVDSNYASSVDTLTNGMTGVLDIL